MAKKISIRSLELLWPQEGQNAAFGLLLAGAIGNPLDKSKVDDVLKRLGYVPLSPLLVPGN